MWGAILGDIIGSPYEGHRRVNGKDFPLFIDDSYITDDSVMTIAIAEALLAVGPDANEDNIKRACIASMQKWGREYPHAGYGGMFKAWLMSDDPQPYCSFGNGSAMRVSPAGWLYDTLDRTLEVAAWTAEVTHDHSEGIKGAQAVSAAIFLARNGYPKDAIRLSLCTNFNYDLSFTTEELRGHYSFDVSCQGSVPESFVAFYDADSFEDAIRNAVSLNGDTDTMGAIAGSIAEAFYDVPGFMIDRAMQNLSPEMLDIIHEMNETVNANFRRLHGEPKRREELMEEVEHYMDLFRDYGIDYPEGYPDTSEEELERWVMTWSEFKG